MDFHKHYKKNVMIELSTIVKKDIKRKVCKDCGLLGHHNKTQLICPIKINEDNEKRKQIKDYILEKDCLREYENDEMFETISEKLKISMNSCKSLYSEIPPEVWINRRMDIDLYIKNIHKCCCNNCCSIILESSKNRQWKGNILCDYCWDSNKGEREIMWEDISKYKPIKCYICKKLKRCRGDRFHYDHINMFDKTDSICCMVDRGDNIKDIFSEIDKCQILCVPCHDTVTDIERKLGFTRIKTCLTRKYNNEEISEKEYNSEKKRYQKLYEGKIKSIYEKLKTIYI